MAVLLELAEEEAVLPPEELAEEEAVLPPEELKAVLPGDLVEEVLLRFPPADPVSLIRVALVCRDWYRMISSPVFQRRFREFHATAPMLGLICYFRREDDIYVSRLIPTSPACPIHDDLINWSALDARHGRVVLACVMEGRESDLVVWDPITYGVHALPPVLPGNAAVLCAAGDACNHLDCHGGPFMVVSLGIGQEGIWLRVYSSNSAFWSKPTYVGPVPMYCVDRGEPATLVGNSLYFPIDVCSRAVRYDLASGETSWIELPPDSRGVATLLMTMEDGALGVARLDGVDARLSLWKLNASPNGDSGWTKLRVVELDQLPVNVLPISSHFVGFAHKLGVFFVEAGGGIFSIDLKSNKIDLVCDLIGVHSVVPYMSFYTPARYIQGEP